MFRIGEEYYYKAFEDPDKCLKVKSKEYLGKAKDIWESIIAQWPQSQSLGLKHAYYFSAVCYRKLGEYENAAEYYQKVVDNWPDYQYTWSAQHLIGQCYENLRNSVGLCPGCAGRQPSLLVRMSRRGRAFQLVVRFRRFFR